MIFSAQESSEDFFHDVLELFYFQVRRNSLYKKYIELLGIDPLSIKHPDKIPFLPISFFKTHKVYSADQTAEKIFYSSGTAGLHRSKHYVADLSLYEKSFMQGFRYFYGDPRNYCFFALLPSYLEQQDSSLVYMMDRLIKNSQFPQSDFFLYNYDELVKQLKENESQKIPTILFGVSFALLELAETYKLKLHHTTVMETGGMKGRRKELTREALHNILKERFGVSAIHSEYGMSELLSQAYAKREGQFMAPPWLKVFIRDIYDPFDFLPEGRSGGINIFDPANKYSVSFIETEDIGKKNANNTFEVLGRIDYSDIRGCNLLVAGE